MYRNSQFRGIRKDHTLVDTLRLIHPTIHLRTMGDAILGTYLESGKAEALPYVQFILRPKGILDINKEVKHGT